MTTFAHIIEVVRTYQERLTDEERVELWRQIEAGYKYTPSPLFEDGNFLYSDNERLQAILKEFVKLPPNLRELALDDFHKSVVSSTAFLELAINA